jgi:hypothetical protein
MVEQTTLNPQRGEVVTSVEPDAVFLEARNAYLTAVAAQNSADQALLASQLVEANAANALSQATTAISLANAAQSTANSALATQVSVTGATMTGPLYASTTSPSAPFELAAKGYVDAQVATVATDAINSVAVLKADTTYVNTQDAALQSQINTGASQIADLYTKLFPQGGIIMWSGPVASIPSGWLLCNGANGTPNLQDRFILGAGGTAYNPGEVGGSTSVTTTLNGAHDHSATLVASGAHNHNITVNNHALTLDQIPPHSHTIRTGGNGTGNPVTTSGSANAYNTSVVGGNGTAANPHSHGASSDTQGSHSHTATILTNGDHTHTVSTMPPFYALCFIMRA